MTFLEGVAEEIRKDYNDNALLLHDDEERAIARIDHWMFNKFTNEEAIKLMDEARAYNTKHHGTKYPPRPEGNVLIMPRSKDDKLMIEKAADYLRQYYSKDDILSLQAAEERVIDRLEEQLGRMSNENAVKLMDDARAYNTKHHGTKYPARPPGNIIITPESKDHLVLTEKVADRMRQAYDEGRPEALPDIEEQIIIELRYDIGRLGNEEAIKLMDAARAHNTRHYGTKYPARPPGQIIVMPNLLAADCAELTVQKAAYYLRQMCGGQDPDVPVHVEAQIIKRLQVWLEKMTNEEAIKLMDDAKSYNINHYGIEYSPRSSDAVLVRPYFKSYELMVQKAAKYLREDYDKDRPFALQHHEEIAVRQLEEKVGKFTNEAAIKLMDEARAYNTKHHGTKYPPRPEGNVLIMPRSKDDKLMIEKAADYIRQAYSDDQHGSLLDIEEQVISELEAYLWLNMTNEEAIRLMDAARKYNTEHHGAEYPEHLPGRVIIKTNISSPDDAAMAVQKAVYCMRQMADDDHILIEEEIIRRMQRGKRKKITEEQATRILDEVDEALLPDVIEAQRDRILYRVSCKADQETISIPHERLESPTSK